LIKSLRFPYAVLSCAVVWRNLILFFHNIVVYIGIMVFCGIPLTLSTLVIFPALLLVSINGIWVATLLGMIGARYRDMQQLIISILQILMFVTPIFWTPTQLKGRTALVLVDYNPLLHYIEIMRSPLLGKPTTLANWGMVLGGTVIGWLFTLFVYSRFRRRVPYWL
jgi:ABC-type polysaccharide/polyol phosphate export permease